MSTDFLFSAVKRKQSEFDVPSENDKLLPAVHRSVLLFEKFFKENRNRVFLDDKYARPLDQAGILQDVLDGGGFAYDLALNLRRIGFVEFYEIMCRCSHELRNLCKNERKDLVLFLRDKRLRGASVWVAALMWPILRSVTRAIATADSPNFPEGDDYIVAVVDDFYGNPDLFEPVTRLVAGRAPVVLLVAAITDQARSSVPADARLRNTQDVYDRVNPPPGVDALENVDMMENPNVDYYYFDHYVASDLAGAMEEVGGYHFIGNEFDADGQEDFATRIKYTFGGNVIAVPDYFEDDQEDFLSHFPPPLAPIDVRDD